MKWSGKRLRRSHISVEVVDHAVARDVRLDRLRREVAPPLDLDLDRVELEVRPICCGRRILRSRAVQYSRVDSSYMSNVAELLTEYECDIPGYSLSMSARNRATHTHTH